MADDVRSPSDRLTVTLAVRGRVVTARPRGSLDTYSVGRFIAALERAPRGRRLLVIDLGEVSMVDSAGVRALSDQVRVAAEQGSRLLIVCPPDWLRRTLAVATTRNPLPVVARLSPAPASTAAPARPPRRRVSATGRAARVRESAARPARTPRVRP